MNLFNITTSDKHLNFKTVLAAFAMTLSLGNATALDADQVVEQVKSRVVNKAISETEGYFNRRFNELANSFGTGRTEISVTGMQNTKPDFSIKTIQPLTTLDENSKEVTFVQGQISSGENHGESRNTINLGIGQRYLVQDDMAIAGVNVFADHETKSKHKRASLGLEYQRTNFTANVNKYYPVSDTKLINGYTEEVLKGHDVKLTGAMPYAPWAKIKGTHYYWDQTKGDNITGNILGVEIELSPSTKLEVGSQNANNADRASYAKLNIQLPFKDDERMTDFALDDEAFRPSGLMDLRLLEMIERNNKIKIEKALNGVTVTMGVFHATTVGASCTLKTSANVTINTTAGTAATGVTASTGLATFDNVIIPTGLIVMACTGGTYTDEATGGTVNAPDTHLVKNYTGGNLSMIAYASPLSEIAYQLANADGDLSDIETESTKVATAFGLNGIDINAVKPTDLNNEAAGDDAAGKVGMALAAIAQMGVSDGTDATATITALKAEISANNGKLKPNRVANAVRELKVNNNAPSKTNINNSAAAEKSIQDNTVEDKGVSVSVSSLSVPEEGTATYTVSLDAEPTADVTITPAETSDAISISGALTFTTANWYTAQTVTVTGITDADSTHETATITHGVSGADYGSITPASVAVTMMDDEAFTFASIANATVAENAVYTGATPSVANAVGSVSYALSGDDAADFTINTTTGVVSMVARNFESPADTGANNVYNLTVTATDAGNTGSTAAQSWTVTVTDVVESASFSIDAIGNTTTAENAAYSVTPSITGTPIGALTYTLVATGNDSNSSLASFDFNNATGVVAATGSGFDYETFTSHTLTLSAEDADGNTASVVSWTVTVENDASDDAIVSSGISYGLVVSPTTGKTWLDKNIGATCDISTASSRTGDGACFGYITSSAAIGESLCPTGFSLPTESEWTAEFPDSNGVTTFTSDVGWSSFLKIPSAGSEGVNGSPGTTLNVSGISGNYYLSSTSPPTNYTIDNVVITSTSMHMGGNGTSILTSTSGTFFGHTRNEKGLVSSGDATTGSVRCIAD